MCRFKGFHFSSPCAALGALQPCRVMSSNTAACSSSLPPRGLRPTPTLQHFPPPPPQLLEPQPAHSAPIPVSLCFILDLFACLHFYIAMVGAKERRTQDSIPLSEDWKQVCASIAPVCVGQPEHMLAGLCGSTYHQHTCGHLFFLHCEGIPVFWLG